MTLTRLDTIYIALKQYEWLAWKLFHRLTDSSGNFSFHLEIKSVLLLTTVAVQRAASELFKRRTITPLMKQHLPDQGGGRFDSLGLGVVYDPDDQIMFTSNHSIKDKEIQAKHRLLCYRVFMPLQSWKCLPSHPCILWRQYQRKSTHTHPLCADGEDVMS